MPYPDVDGGAERLSGLLEVRGLSEVAGAWGLSGAPEPSGGPAVSGAPDLGRFRIRKAQAADAVQLWLLANDREVRQNAFYPKPIPLASHLRWFASKLASPASRIWVGEVGVSQAGLSEAGAVTAAHAPCASHVRYVMAGQVRYDRLDGRVAEIGIALFPPFRRRGLGTRLLEATWHHACVELEVSTLQARVRVENEASLRLFERAGFRCVGQSVVNGHPCYVLERTCREP